MTLEIDPLLIKPIQISSNEPKLGSSGNQLGASRNQFSADNHCVKGVDKSNLSKAMQHEG